MTERISAQCQLRRGDQFSSGTATIDREQLTFRGYFQLALALTDIRSVEVKRDILKLETADGYLTLKLGKPAEAHRWADFIRASR